jgi:hypothetical protein
MISVRRWRIGVAIIIGSVIFVAIARAEETFQIMGCSAGTFTSLSESRALTIYNIVGKGIAWGVTGDKTFDDMTWQFTAVLRVMDDNTIGMGYYKFMDPAGNYFILEGTGATVLEGGTWRFLHGTGQWKGITGQTKARFVMRGKPLSLETEQYWCRIIGTLQLPR